MNTEKFQNGDLIDSGKPNEVGMELNNNNSPTPEQIESFVRSGYSHSEAFSAALRENQRAEKRMEM